MIAFFRRLWFNWKLKTGRASLGRQPMRPVNTRLKATLSAVVRRADGTVEDRGVLHTSSLSLPSKDWDQLKQGRL